MATISSPTTSTVLAVPQTPCWVISNPAAGTQIALARVALMSTAQTNVAVPVSLDTSTTEQAATFYGWNNPYPTVQRGTVQAPTFTIAVTLQGYANATALLNLLGRGTAATQATLLLRSDMGDLWWIVAGPTIDVQTLRSPDRATDPRYIITIPVTVVASP